MKLNEAVRKTKKVSDSMPGERWGVFQRLSDLVEEVGELSSAIQVEEGWKSRKRAKTEIVDSICDSLYALFCIASIYNVNLDEEYPKVLEQIDRRRKNGDFDHI